MAQGQLRDVARDVVGEHGGNYGRKIGGEYIVAHGRESEPAHKWTEDIVIAGSSEVKLLRSADNARRQADAASELDDAGASCGCGLVLEAVGEIPGEKLCAKPESGSIRGAVVELSEVEERVAEWIA